IYLTTGTDADAWKYTFIVESLEDGWPTGILSATNPEGQETQPMAFSLHGCGKWTTRSQNPVQTQEKAFTPYYDGLIEGSFFWGAAPESRDRYSFDNPGQELTAIQIEKNVL
ncbi:MAG TPA: hypothetical protein VFS65_00810, partial [Candidatus Saccharimonadales bacterium]|nr:hypothetical protein [Candidatus Saccharimonadales bacterium]